MKPDQISLFWST